jgi:large subunit ribosomal protein L35Ae
MRAVYFAFSKKYCGKYLFFKVVSFIKSCPFPASMNGTIVNYRRNRHTQDPKHLIIKIENVIKRDEAKKYVGKTVVYNTGKKEMKGKIAAAHGNSGCVRAIFETGLPGQALGKKVTLS